MTEEPPAIRSIKYSIEDAGVWLTWTPAIGPPATIFVPNRMLAGLARILARRVTMLADGDRKEQDA